MWSKIVNFTPKIANKNSWFFYYGRDRQTIGSEEIGGNALICSPGATGLEFYILRWNKWQVIAVVGIFCFLYVPNTVLLMSYQMESLHRYKKIASLPSIHLLNIRSFSTESQKMSTTIKLYRMNSYSNTLFNLSLKIANKFETNLRLSTSNDVLSWALCIWLI